MKEARPSWPHYIPRVFKPIANVVGLPRFGPYEFINGPGKQSARMRKLEEERQGGLTFTWAECFFSNRADFTAVASTNSEASLIAGLSQQPTLPPLYFNGDGAFGRGISLIARGVFSTTGTPTLTFQWRMGTTVGPTFYSGASIGVSAAITSQSAVTNKYWESRLDLVCNTPGLGGTNTTLSGAGYVMSPSGFASPFIYPLEPTTPDTGTWTIGIDASVMQFINFSMTWSASSASNTITCKQLLALGLN